MRNLCKMVGVTYGEFLSWYNYGEIRICSSRVVDLETTPDGTREPESPHVLTLLDNLLGSRYYDSRYHQDEVA